jgi:hypothetical protein
LIGEQSAEDRAVHGPISGNRVESDPALPEFDVLERHRREPRVYDICHKKARMCRDMPLGSFPQLTRDGSVYDSSIVTE